MARFTSRSLSMVTVPTNSGTRSTSVLRLPLLVVRMKRPATMMRRPPRTMDPVSTRQRPTSTVTAIASPTQTEMESVMRTRFLAARTTRLATSTRPPRTTMIPAHSLMPVMTVTETASPTRTEMASVTSSRCPVVRTMRPATTALPPRMMMVPVRTRMLTTWTVMANA